MHHQFFFYMKLSLDNSLDNLNTILTDIIVYATRKTSGEEQQKI